MNSQQKQFLEFFFLLRLSYLIGKETSFDLMSETTIKVDKLRYLHVILTNMILLPKHFIFQSKKFNCYVFLPF